MMKIRTSISAILFFAFIVNAQTTQVPKPVADAFKKLYPKVSEVKWDKEGNNFEASFKAGGSEVSVVLSAEGKLLETETSIELKDVPKGITSFLQQEYPGFKITETTRIIDATDSLNYEIEITINHQKKDLLFDKNGNAIEKNNKEAEPGEDKEDED